jgi:hypothetical protein
MLSDHYREALYRYLAFCVKNIYSNENDSHILNSSTWRLPYPKRKGQRMQSTPAAHSNEEYNIPCAEALLAGTMALMTGHMQDSCGMHREAMSAKIVCNLAALADAPMLSPGFKQFVGALRQRWQRLDKATVPDATLASEHSFQHASPTALQ